MEKQLAAMQLQMERLMQEKEAYEGKALRLQQVGKSQHLFVIQSLRKP